MSDNDTDRWAYIRRVAERARRQQAKDVPTTRDEWEMTTPFPDDADLGYQTEDWDTMDADPGQQIYLPTCPDEIVDDAFVVAREDVVIDLERVV